MYEVLNIKYLNLFILFIFVFKFVHQEISLYWDLVILVILCYDVAFSLLGIKVMMGHSNLIYVVCGNSSLNPDYSFCQYTYLTHTTRSHK